MNTNKSNLWFEEKVGHVAAPLNSLECPQRHDQLPPVLLQQQLLLLHLVGRRRTRMPSPI